jgi:hypothetical protein
MAMVRVRVRVRVGVGVRVRVRVKVRFIMLLTTNGINRRTSFSILCRKSLFREEL